LRWELLRLLLYLLSWTIYLLCIFDPPNHVSQQLQKAPSVQGKRSSTSYLSYMTSLTCS